MGGASGLGSTEGAGWLQEVKVGALTVQIEKSGERVPGMPVILCLTFSRKQRHPFCNLQDF